MGGEERGYLWMVIVLIAARCHNIMHDYGSVCLPAWLLSVCLSVLSLLHVGLSTRFLSTWPSVYSPDSQSASLCLHLSVCLFLFHCVLFFLPLSLQLCLFILVYLSICMSVCLFLSSFISFSVYISQYPLYRPLSRFHFNRCFLRECTKRKGHCEMSTVAVTEGGRTEELEGG